MRSLSDFAQKKQAALDQAARARRPVPLRRQGGHVLDETGQRFVNFASNDYLGLSQHPRVVGAAQDALQALGLGAGASRLVTGSAAVQHELEQDLAQLKQKPAALVFGSGYLANTGTIPALVGPDDLVILDELAHACLHAGAQLSRARVRHFAHNDLDALRSLLAAERARHPHVLVATEGVFSMDGDRADVASLSALCREHDAWLYVDDAHATGVLGQGRGSTGGHDVPLVAGTLSKALGAYGGFVCAADDVVRVLHSRARTQVYSTALPPPVLAGARAALAVMRDEPERGQRAMSHAQTLCRGLGLPETESTIVKVVLGDDRRALGAQAALAEAGYWVTAIRPPTVPDGTARLRIACTALHEDDDIAGLVAALGPLLA